MCIYLYTSYDRGPYSDKFRSIDFFNHGVRVLSSKNRKIFYNITSEEEFRHQLEGGAL